jgi:predicted amidohydrolase/GNAT superfamily N-acetyltransferase
MKICIAQTKSLCGAIEKNISSHLSTIEKAVSLNADIIIFPELSVTNYEPSLAPKLATKIDDPLFAPFQSRSTRNNITIGVGMPTICAEGLRISMLIFQPKKSRSLYSKRILPLDEKSIFSPGIDQTILNIHGIKIALGICFETLQRSHFIEAIKNKADIYVASVAKSNEGIQRAVDHFKQLSKEFNTPILMSNCVGPADNFIAAGQSSVWNRTGICLDRLDSTNNGLIIYDISRETSEKHQVKIELATAQDIEDVYNIYLKAKEELENRQIFQWSDNYPNRNIIESDISRKELYIIKEQQTILGAINISEHQEKEYETIDWKFQENKIMVIHRLVVHPEHQRQGYAKLLMHFAEEHAKTNKYTSIRLDAFSQNKDVLTFYNSLNYIIRGTVFFPERIAPFVCLEKNLL